MRDCLEIRSNGCPIFSASTRRCSCCCPIPRPPTSGSVGRTRRRRFGGRSALDRMLSGKVADLYIVRQYLDAAARLSGQDHGPWTNTRPGSRFPKCAGCPAIASLRAAIRPFICSSASRPPADWDALYALESMTNPRLRDGARRRSNRSPRSDRSFGPGGFGDHGAVHCISIPPGPASATRRFGAFYAGGHIWPRRSRKPATTARSFCARRSRIRSSSTMRCYLADLSARFHDIRGQRRATVRNLRSPHSYVASQVLGRELQVSGIERHCLRQRAARAGANASPCIARAWCKICGKDVHLRYVWDGESYQLSVYELRPSRLAGRLYC